MLKNSGFEIEIVHGDALQFKADVLMLKFAPQSSGLDRVVLGMLGQEALQVSLGDYRVLPSEGKFGCSQVLMVGTVSMGDIGYQHLRQLGHNMLANLNNLDVDVTHVITTAHGVSTNKRSLDEEEALRSLILGFADAADGGQIPDSLERLTIIERNEHRVELFKDALRKFFPQDIVFDVDKEAAEKADRRGDATGMVTSVASLDEAAQKPVANDATPHVFVAMPFAEEFDDQYYLAIRPAVTTQNLLCVRLDQEESTFTGDIMEQVKERIRSAKFVIALLDWRNPNVYLEVGYAWGVGTPTILILHEGETPPFDVQGSRLMIYKRIHKLKDQLSDELRHLI